MTRVRNLCGGLLFASLTSAAFAEQFHLLTGVDATRYPGSARTIFITPGPGFPGTFTDGDRLAGTPDVGPVAEYQGVAPGPLFAPNEFGSLSFLYRRGSVPVGGGAQVPFLGIEFLGGPLLDLDGDLENGVRSLIPEAGVTAAVIPDTDSYIDLDFDLTGGEVFLDGFDATGTNEGGPGQAGTIATITVVLAGTQPNGAGGPPINPTIDTRVGTVSQFGGHAGVYRITDLGYELWEDTLLASPTTGPFLGTLQYLGRFNGWLIERDANGAWPTLAGIGMGGTVFPAVNNSQLGATFNTANGVAGGIATITTAVGVDDFSASPPNGGLPLTAFGGDLGAYIEEVVLPVVPKGWNRVVYLESAGWGINNSFDPLFGDTSGYDAVIIAAAPGDACAGFTACDANCDGVISVGDIGAFVLAVTQGEAEYAAQFPTCSYRCANDTNGDGQVSVGDIAAFVSCLTGR
jgi:hypothetical protein